MTQPMGVWQDPGEARWSWTYTPADRSWTIEREGFTYRTVLGADDRWVLTVRNSVLAFETRHTLWREAARWANAFGRLGCTWVAGADSWVGACRRARLRVTRAPGGTFAASVHYAGSTAQQQWATQAQAQAWAEAMARHMTIRGDAKHQLSGGV